MADEDNHINKNKFTVPFVCGCRNLGEALRQSGRGRHHAADQGRGRHGERRRGRPARADRAAGDQAAGVDGRGRALRGREADEAPYDLVKYVAGERARLPVVNFAAGGVATPADAALMMQLGMDGVFVGSGIFKSEDPERAKAIVRAVAHYSDASTVRDVRPTSARPWSASPTSRATP